MLERCTSTTMPSNAFRGIQQDDRRVGETTGIHDKGSGVTAGFVNRIDELPFMVALEKLHVESERCGPVANLPLDIRECLEAVNVPVP